MLITPIGMSLIKIVKQEEQFKCVRAFIVDAGDAKSYENASKMACPSTRKPCFRGLTPRNPGKQRSQA